MGRRRGSISGFAVFFASYIIAQVVVEFADGPEIFHPTWKFFEEIAREPPFSVQSSWHDT